MKNTLTDLNNHLFAQMERLSEESLSVEQLAFEAERSKSLTIIARTIVDNARLVLDAQTRIRQYACRLIGFLKVSLRVSS
ncbi:MAG TPA: hypothetical protein DCW48_10590 [Methylotenera mobilis]|uniref:Uncharacterized protein n=1 Tax=Methylotenera mobilis TaxID=359408 RepID=A0A351RD06_9PROT|nr:hypothetical protein [Methylotenera mobilis]